jgi:hypothetical protein
MEHVGASYDVFLIFPEATLRFALHRTHVRALKLHADGQALLGVDVHYRSETDTAMLGLRMDPRRLTQEVIDRVIEVARSAELPMFQPERLAVRDQRKFYESYLTTYERRVRNLHTPDAAMRLLARWLSIPTSPPNENELPAERMPIEVRFQRGDTWHLGRLCSLSTGGIYVASGVPPRAGDAVALEITTAGETIPLAAVVVQVTALEAASTLGVAGFGARFVEDDSQPRRRLLELLARTGSSHKIVAQPPRRRHVRYPVRVAVSVEFLGSQLVTVALDLSAGGAFVKSPLPPLRDDMAISLALPGEDTPVVGHAHVARTVDEGTALERGVPAGFGVAMEPASTGHADRLRIWLSRVSRRMGCAVLVAGGSPRVGELAAELSAVGYAAAAMVGDLSALGERLRAGLAPDAVVLDVTAAAPQAIARATREANEHGARVIVAGPEPLDAVRARVDEQVARV